MSKSRFDKWAEATWEEGTVIRRVIPAELSTENLAEAVLLYEKAIAEGWLAGESVERKLAEVREELKRRLAKQN